MIRLQRAAYRYAIRPILFRFDPEVIHERMIRLLSLVPATTCAKQCDGVEVAGIRFPNRVGLAAGLDKDALAAAAWAHLGFGFAELGTVTALPQPGNPKPRIFRLPSSGAIINRMGFNNEGADMLVSRLRARGVVRGNRALGIPLGISIGKSRVVAVDHAVDDYLTSLRTVASVADYVALNVSSPNTPGLRQLEVAEEIRSLVGALVGEAKRLDESNPIPIFVKFSPDHRDVEAAVDVVEAAGARGIIATNTTLARHVHPRDFELAKNVGGLSGAPLTARALKVVERIAARTTLPVIGVGGICSPRDAQRMFDAGASLLQLYTGFIYQGPALVRAIHHWSQP